MAHPTLLEMTQEILSALNSDEVNSIGDSTEAMQVATIIKRKYYDIMAREDLPLQNELFQLDSSTDSTKPVLMTVPASVSSIHWIKYYDSNILDSASNQAGFSHDLNLDLVPTNPAPGSVPAPGYLYVTMIPIDQFLEMINRLDPTLTNVGTYTFNDAGRDFTFYYYNDRQPKWCTIISNAYVLFDAYDSTQDSTLQTSKTMCWGEVLSPFLMEDSFIPDIDDGQFPLLINEAKTLAFFELKQTPHVKAEQEVRRQWIVTQKAKSLAERPSYFDQLANFGRIPGTGGYNRSWNKL